ncbi:MAG: 50S ribosomal protein L30 [Chloroflexi bacterium]|nr:50S ribosomal protein L30 [Chloroflexota bacterium]
MAKVRITLVRSSARRRFDQKQTVRALGLRKLGHTVEHSDSPTLRGMIHKVQHLITVEEAEE